MQGEHLNSCTISQLKVLFSPFTASSGPQFFHQARYPGILTPVCHLKAALWVFSRVLALWVCVCVTPGRLLEVCQPLLCSKCHSILSKALSCVQIIQAGLPETQPSLFSNCLPPSIGDHPGAPPLLQPGTCLITQGTHRLYGLHQDTSESAKIQYQMVLQDNRQKLGSVVTLPVTIIQRDKCNNKSLNTLQYNQLGWKAPEGTGLLPMRKSLN